MNKYFFTLLFCFQGLFAQNTDHFNTVLKQLQLKEKQINLNLFTQKVLPYDKEKSVLVIPKYQINEEDEEGHFYFVIDAYIVVINNVTGKIITKYFEPGAWTSDAFVLSGITIDTGLYVLNKTTRAFGIRVEFNGSSRPNPFGEIDLSLYVLDKNSLKSVLKNYPISEYRGDWDTRCNGEFEDSNSTIDVDKLQTNNFNNLIVKTKIVKTKSTLKNDDCISQETSKKLVSKLIFNGKEYK